MEKEITFIEKKKETEEVYSFTFKKPDGLNWKSGQHGVFKLKEAPKSGKNFRVFSFVSSSMENNLVIATRIREDLSDFKKGLMNLEEGDKVNFQGPYGSFHLMKSSTDYIAIAGGIGITPFMSIIHDVAKNPDFSNVNIDLIYSSQNQDFAFKEQLDEFSKNKSITIHYVNDRAEAKETLELLAPKQSESSLYYIAGSPVMVQNLKEFLAVKGIPLERFRSDNFEGY